MRVFGTEGTARTNSAGGGNTGCLGTPKRHMMLEQRGGEKRSQRSLWALPPMLETLSSPLEATESCDQLGEYSKIMILY